MMAALLVERGIQPQALVDELPKDFGDVVLAYMAHRAAEAAEAERLAAEKAEEERVRLELRARLNASRG